MINEKSSKINAVMSDNKAQEYFNTLPKMMQENIVQSGMHNCTKEDLMRYVQVNGTTK